MIADGGRGCNDGGPSVRRRGRSASFEVTGDSYVEFNKLIWSLQSPKWHFDDATFDRTAAAYKNPDHVAIVIHNYRWRIGLAPGDPAYDSLENKLYAGPVVTQPTITIASDFDGANAAGTSYRSKFTGRYSHQVLDGIGHDVPQEAPEAFADAIIEVAGY